MFYCFRRPLQGNQPTSEAMKKHCAGFRGEGPKLSLSVARTGSVGNVRGDDIIIDTTPPIMTGKV